MSSLTLRVCSTLSRLSAFSVLRIEGSFRKFLKSWLFAAVFQTCTDRVQQDSLGVSAQLAQQGITNLYQVVLYLVKLLGLVTCNIESGRVFASQPVHLSRELRIDTKLSAKALAGLQLETGELEGESVRRDH